MVKSRVIIKIITPYVDIFLKYLVIIFIITQDDRVWCDCFIITRDDTKISSKIITRDDFSNHTIWLFESQIGMSTGLFSYGVFIFELHKKILENHFVKFEISYTRFSSMSWDYVKSQNWPKFSFLGFSLKYDNKGLQMKVLKISLTKNRTNPRHLE